MKKYTKRFLYVITDNLLMEICGSKWIIYVIHNTQWHSVKLAK